MKDSLILSVLSYKSGNKHIIPCSQIIVLKTQNADIDFGPICYPILVNSVYICMYFMHTPGNYAKDWILKKQTKVYSRFLIENI